MGLSGFYMRSVTLRWYLMEFGGLAQNKGDPMPIAMRNNIDQSEMATQGHVEQY